MVTAIAALVAAVTAGGVWLLPGEEARVDGPLADLVQSNRTIIRAERIAGYGAACHS